MIPFVRWILGLLPLQQRGRRPCEETLADWRSEDAAAHGSRRAITTLRGLWSVGLCVSAISWRELRTREGALPLLRIAALSVVLAAGFGWEQARPLASAGLAIGPPLAMLGAVGATCVFMPLVAFVAGATGRRLAIPAPRLGPVLAIALVMFVTMGWLMPAASQAWRQQVFSLTGGRGALAPGLNERSLFELFPMLFTSQFTQVTQVFYSRSFFLLATPVFLAIGVTSRSMVCQRRLACSVLPIAIFVVPFLAPRSTVLMLMWLALLGAVLVTRTLARTSEPQQALS